MNGANHQDNIYGEDNKFEPSSTRVKSMFINSNASIIPNQMYPNIYVINTGKDLAEKSNKSDILSKKM